LPNSTETSDAITTTVTTSTSLSAITSITTSSSTGSRHPKDPDPTSLFCFSLALPSGSAEPELLRWQHSEHRGIFACDEHAVYSNITSKILRTLKPRIFDADLSCPKGGTWHTRLNTWIFMKLWRQVFEDGQFRLAAWTVKVDPDAVFLAERLRDVVADTEHAHAQQGNGMFGSNCEYKHSLHGALELLSRRALEVYAADNKEKCREPPQEDVYLRECLLALGVKELKDWELLAEESCFWDWKSCTSARVTFHPFKELKAHKECAANADVRGSWATRKLLSSVPRLRENPVARHLLDGTAFPGAQLASVRRHLLHRDLGQWLHWR
jgi:hypothetical protein